MKDLRLSGKDRCKTMAGGELRDLPSEVLPVGTYNALVLYCALSHGAPGSPGVPEWPELLQGSDQQLGW